MKTFDRVVLWHHGLNDVPAETHLDYWNGSSWQASAFSLATTHSATSGNTAAAWTSNATLPAWASQTDGSYSVHDLRGALARLPVVYREAVVLCDLQELSYADAAAAAACAMGTLRSRLHRGRALLARALRELAEQRLAQVNGHAR